MIEQMRINNSIQTLLIRVGARFIATSEGAVLRTAHQRGGKVVAWWLSSPPAPRSANAATGTPIWPEQSLTLAGTWRRFPAYR